MATISSVHAVNEQTMGVPYPYTDERSAGGSSDKSSTSMGMRMRLRRGFGASSI